MKLRKECKHYNGVFQETCEAGISYVALVPDQRGRVYRLPCATFEKSVDQVSCDAYETYTEEELEAHEKAWDARMERIRIIMPVVSQWRKKAPWGRVEVIECPACKGKLHLSQAASNGHVWGKCETEGCASWME